MDHTSAPGACLNARTIALLQQGKLTHPQLDELRRHVSQCPKCSAQISDDSTTILSMDDETFQSLAKAGLAEPSLAATDPLVVEHDAIDSLMRRLQQPEQQHEIGRLGRYRVLDTLGAGGMGVVFRAEDPQLRRQVALKVMIPRTARDPVTKERFVREAQATAAIEHDNVVAIYEVNEDGEMPYLAMQLLRGESLKTRIERAGQLSEEQILRIAREAACGLEAAHQQGLIHRDIKPENIWLESGSDRVKILDFGLVHAAQEDNGLTRTGTVMGTPRYMAPEQALGQKVDPRSDLFSLGSIMYLLASGKSPFAGDSLAETLIAVVQCTPEPIEFASPAISAPLASLIGRMLQKIPEDRPPSALEVVRSIEQIETQIREGNDGGSLAETSLKTREPRGSAAASNRPVSGNPRAWRVGIAALLTIVVGVIVAAMVGRDSDPKAKHAETPSRGADVALQSGTLDVASGPNARDDNGSVSLPAHAQPTAAAPVLELLYDGRPPQSVKLREVALTLSVEAVIPPSTSPSPLALGGTLRAEVDQYAIRIKTLAEGHLYVIQVDATGRCFWIHPKNETLPEWSFGSNPLPAETQVRLPSGESDSMFFLDSTTGIEHIYAVLSPGPWSELETRLSRSAAEGAVVSIGKPFQLGLRGIGGIAKQPSLTQPRQYTSERGEPLVVEWWFQHAPAPKSIPVQ